MNCSKCTASLGDDASFCEACGQEVSRVKSCPGCSKPGNVNAKFCKFCGIDTSASARPPVNPPWTTSEPDPVHGFQPRAPDPDPPMRFPIFVEEPTVAAAPGNDPDDAADDPGSFISPSGAAFAVICFFLPWTVNVCHPDASLTGKDLASNNTILWLIPVMGLVSFAAYFFFKHRNTTFRARPFIVAASLIGVGLMAYLAITIAADLWNDQEFSVFLVLRYGFYGSLLGFILAGVGCLFMSRNTGPEYAFSLTNEQELTQ